MKMFKKDSELEKKVQQVEKLMKELGIQLHYGYRGLKIVTEHGSYPIRDTESSDTSVQFPRAFESERLIVPE
jgi:hypothetical protein